MGQWVREAAVNPKTHVPPREAAVSRYEGICMRIAR